MYGRKSTWNVKYRVTMESKYRWFTQSIGINVKCRLEWWIVLHLEYIKCQIQSKLRRVSIDAPHWVLEVKLNVVDLCGHKCTWNVKNRGNWLNKLKSYYEWSCISCVMVSMLTSNAVYCGFESHSDKTKDYKIGICCFSAKHAALRSTCKCKDWLARKQDNVFEWSDMSIVYWHRLLFQWPNTIKIKLSLLV